MNLVLKIETLDIPHNEEFKRRAIRAVKNVLDQINWSTRGTVHHQTASFTVEEVSPSLWDWPRRRTYPEPHRMS